MNYMREEDEEPEELSDIAKKAMVVCSALKQVDRH